MMEELHEELEAYDGPATVGGVEVEVRLRGRFEPLDGRFHWWGRVGASGALDATYRSGSTVQVVTPHGSAEAKLSDRDFHGRMRLTATGRPPF